MCAVISVNKAHTDPLRRKRSATRLVRDIGGSLKSVWREAVGGDSEQEARGDPGPTCVVLR